MPKTPKKRTRRSNATRYQYEKCFYDARNLKKDVLKRKYRPLREILRRVRDWAAARKTRRADWNPIGGPRSHTPAKITAALSL